MVIDLGLRRSWLRCHRLVRPAGVAPLHGPNGAAWSRPLAGAAWNRPLAGAHGAAANNPLG